MGITFCLIKITIQLLDKTQKSYQLGDTIQVKVKTDFNKKQIDLELY